MPKKIPDPKDPGDCLESKITIYDSPYIKVTSLEQARVEVNFLRKAFNLKMFNKINYLGSKIKYPGSQEEGLSELEVNAANLEKCLAQIVKYAVAGKLPFDYSVGMEVDFEMSTLINEEKQEGGYFNTFMVTSVNLKTRN